ncbi:MAG: glycosyltransferase family 25 protein, partial [Acidimicrobiales bacterium]
MHGGEAADEAETRRRPTICLNMIVRDEAHVVAEALACVARHIDRWVIVDTGSVDGTIELIRSFFAERGIPGELHERRWVDFGTNRTEALDLAAGQADYTWVIDADDLVEGDLDLTGLDADAYTLRYGRDALTFWRTQIFRSSLPWRFEGVVHEYPTCDPAPARIERLDGHYNLVWRSIGARNVVPGKFDRDAAQLAVALETRPDDARNTFYLAQSLLDGGRPAEALEHYDRRIALGGWDEEVFYSQLRRSRCLAELDRPWPEIQDAYLRAWAARPSRGEPLHELARHHREAGDHQLAHHFARLGAALPLPDDLLFVAADVHRWRLLDELAISAYWAGHLEEALSAGSRLLDEGFLPEEERARVARNREFAVAALAPSRLAHRPDLVAEVAARVAEDGGGDVTFTMTTGRRRDLFEQTMDSFLACCDDRARIGRWIVIDEQSSAEDRVAMVERYPFIELVAKGPEDAGHARSMNLLRDLVDTPWWLHLEDDWQFVVTAPFLGRAIEVLEDDAFVGQVLWNRAYAETLEDRDVAGGEVGRTASGFRYWRQRPLADEALASHVAALGPGGRTNAWWPGYSLRPSLARTEAVVALGPYDEAAEHFELEHARRWAAAGLVTAAFDDITCVHLGPLTSEHGAERRPNAYDLVGQSQFTAPAVATSAAIRVINLDRRPDRLSTFRRRLHDAAGPALADRCRRFPAVDGSLVELTEELTHLFRGNDHGFRRSVVGCALSHLGLWEEAAAGDQLFVVFEDDAEPAPALGERLEQVLAAMSANDPSPGLVFLGHVRLGPPLPAPPPGDPTTTSLAAVGWDGFMGGTFAYVVTPEGAGRLLAVAARDGIVEPIDAFLRDHA